MKKLARLFFYLLWFSSLQTLLVIGVLTYVVAADVDLVAYVTKRNLDEVLFWAILFEEPVMARYLLAYIIPFGLLQIAVLIPVSYIIKHFFLARTSHASILKHLIVAKWSLLITYVLEMLFFLTDIFDLFGVDSRFEAVVRSIEHEVVATSLLESLKDTSYLYTIEVSGLSLLLLAFLFWLIQKHLGIIEKVTLEKEKLEEEASLTI